jgi:predicted DNA-binding transcriptional regulator YafY
MGRSSFRTVNQRQHELLGLLRSRETWTSRELASELAVSLRTLMRSLVALQDEGIPIESDRGRGGGVRLDRTWAGPLKLNYREAIDLLLCISVMEQAGSPLLLRHLRSIKNKLALAFMPPQRKRLLELRRRIWVGGAASPHILATYGACKTDCSERLHEAFFELRCLRIRYLADTGTVSDRLIEPQFLHYWRPIWYVLAWDVEKAAVRSFRVDRIKSAALLDQTFALRSDALFMQAFADFSGPI